MNRLIPTRWALVLLLTYTILPTVGRMILAIGGGDPTGIGADPWFLVGVLWPNALVLAVLVIGARRQQSGLADWGFTMTRGFWVSLGLVLVMSVVYAVRMPLAWTFPSLLVVVLMFGVWIEELLFRALLINVLMGAIRSVKYRRHLSVLLSAIIFTAVHIPMKTGPELSGIFLGGLFFGYFYVLSGSLLVPLFVHTVSNTVMQSGLVGGILTVVVYFALAGLSRVFAGPANSVERGPTPFADASPPTDRSESL